MNGVVRGHLIATYSFDSVCECMCLALYHRFMFTNTPDNNARKFTCPALVAAAATPDLSEGQKSSLVV